MSGRVKVPRSALMRGSADVQKSALLCGRDNTALLAQGRYIRIFVCNMEFRDETEQFRFPQNNTIKK
jgi:hypothetical protein